SSYSATWQGEQALTQANVSATFNLRGLGSGFDEFANKRWGSNGNFFHANADIDHTRDLKYGVQFYAKVSGQIADSPLVSSEQFSVGGADSVRGYLESETIGDTGIVGTLELRGPDFAQRLPMEIKGAGEEKGRKLFNEWRLFAFVDAGYTMVHEPGAEQEK